MRAHGPVMAGHGDSCLNCGAALTGPYCAACGQKRPHTDVTLREFVRETTAELTHWDGKVPATLKALFTKPGLLTLDFLAGRRARWLPPLRVYLICSVAYFVSGPLVETVTHRSFREVAKLTITNTQGDTALTAEERGQIAEGLPARLFGVERLERAARDPARLNHMIKAAFPKAMFVLLPLFALLTNVLWRGKQPRYPAHLYLALHTHAAWFGGLTVMTIVTGFLPPGRAATVAGVALLSYVGWYGLLAVRRVFGDPWVGTVAKGLVLSVVYATCLFAASLAMLGYAILQM